MTKQILALFINLCVVAGCQTTQNSALPPSCLAETQSFFNSRQPDETAELIASNDVIAAGFIDENDEFLRGLFIMPAEMVHRQLTQGASVSKISECRLPDGAIGKAILVAKQEPNT